MLNQCAAIPSRATNNPHQHANCYPHILGRNQRVTRPKLHRGNPSRSGNQGRRQSGHQLSNGSIITTINERPIIAFKGSIPAYRDLVVGARGDDVKQLQEALESLGYSIWDEEGNYGEATANAVYRFLIVATTLPGILTEPKKTLQYRTAAL